MSNDISRALPIILQFEGGLVDDPNDPGGRTNKGVTKKVYDAFRQRKGLPIQDVALISDEEVREIYKGEYWDTVGGDTLEWPINLILFDTAVNTGVKQALTLKTSAGDVTDSSFKYKYLLYRAQFYGSICFKNIKLVKFLPGWLKRTIKLASY